MNDAWTTMFAKSWLDSRDACREMDDQIAIRVDLARGSKGSAAPDVLPVRCAPTADALRTLGIQPECAIHCTILLALLGELLLCAEDGGILRKDAVERFAGGEPEREVTGEAMRLLRNAACHPASVADHGDETGIVSFADFVVENFKEELWAPPLRSQPGNLATREVAFFALRLVQSVGLDRADHWRLRMKSVKRRHPR